MQFSDMQLKPKVFKSTLRGEKIMADCYKTIDFLREYARMHREQKAKKDKKKMYCEDCPLAALIAICHANCTQAMMRCPQEAIQIVQKWSDEHPRETMIDHLKKQHPKVQLDEDGVPAFCPSNIGYEEDHSCDKDCIKCWNRPYMEENDI